jgi:HD-GYP domain-containing protein (c-di-GMP phosphodiesterase class II)
MKFFIIDTEQGCDAVPLRSRAAIPNVHAAAGTASAMGDRCSAEEEFGRVQDVAEDAARTVTELLSDARLGKAIDVERTLPAILGISQSIERNSSALTSYLRIKAADDYTYFHSVAVCALMINLGRQLLFDEQTIADLGMAGLLHDLGKALVPIELIKKPGKLTPAEMALVRQHPVKGAEVLGRSRNVSDVTLDVCLHHHERVDGAGYPHRLKGEAISLHARMAAICDVYDACTSKRAYKDAHEPSEVLADMFRAEGQFDQQVLSAFIRSVGIYPVGSLVRLKSGRLAVVIEQNGAALTQPRVRAFYSIARRIHMPGQDIDLAQDGEDEILSREDPVRWGFRSWEAMWSQLLRAGAGGMAAAA